MNSPIAVFKQLISQVCAIRDSAEVSESSDLQNSLRRASLVLTVAALDTYMHEMGIKKLAERWKSGQDGEEAVRQYIGVSNSAIYEYSDIDNVVRNGLSRKTLTYPDRIDKLLSVCGLSADSTWDLVSIRMHVQQKILRNQLNVLCDRRNMIAHEGDWDSYSYRFRDLTKDSLSEAISSIMGTVENFNTVIFD